MFFSPRRRKGRLGMNWLNSIRILLVVGLIAASVIGGDYAKADFIFGEPTNLGPLINSSSNDNPFSVSSDGLELYFGSDRPGGSGGWDIWITKRSTTDDEWGSPENLGPIVNSPEMEYAADISPDGLKLHLISYRSGGLGKDDVWLSTRTSRDEPWTDPVNVGPPVSSQYDENGVTVSDDGLELYFMSGSRPGRVGDWDMWVCKRLSVTDPWGEPENLSALNSTYKEGFISLSPDGLVIFFDSDRPGGIGDWDLWMSRRSSRQEPWMTPVNLGPTINSPNLDAMGALSHDGRMLYFNSTRNVLLGGEWGDIWQAPIIPIVDFDGDGNIYTSDLVMLIDGWGTNDTLYDIGPMPWGDGIVDIEDLKVFIEYWEQENMLQGQKKDQ
jgi:hypothetical protein